MVKASIAAFDSSSQRLLNEYSSEADSCAKLQKFIDGCQYACMSNLNWGLVSFLPPSSFHLPWESL